MRATWPILLGSVVNTTSQTLRLFSPVGTESDTRHDREHDTETSETVNSNSVQCKHRWTASRLVVGHLCTAANGQAWFLTAQESFLQGEGSLQRHVQPLN